MLKASRWNNMFNLQGRHTALIASTVETGFGMLFDCLSVGPLDHFYLYFIWEIRVLIIKA